MKECGILGVKTYSDPFYIFSRPSPRIYAPVHAARLHTLTWVVVSTQQLQQVGGLGGHFTDKNLAVFLHVLFCLQHNDVICQH